MMRYWIIAHYCNRDRFLYRLVEDGSIEWVGGEFEAQKYDTEAEALAVIKSHLNGRGYATECVLALFA